MRDKKKLIILIALIAAVGVSIGFAAFSSSLLIKSSLSVDPSSNEFSVVFSSSSTSLATSDITPSKSDSTLTVNNAKIDNSGTYPTISNLGGTFTAPGQSITYTFYALNTGKYDAYLTSIVFQNLTSGVFKECKATDGTNSDLVTSACNNIGITVQVGSETATSTTLGISNHKLLQGASETVTITLTYESNGALADEPFTVNFGNIYLTYGTVETEEMPNLPEASICTAVNGSKSGSTDLGTEYNCQVNNTTAYNFYVLSTDGDNVNLLMSKNLVDNVRFVSNDPLTNDDWSVETYIDYNLVDLYALNQLEELTGGWTNISNINQTISTAYGAEMTLTGKARLATFEELAGPICTSEPINNDGYGYAERYDSAPYYTNCASWAVGDYWTMTVSSFINNIYNSLMYAMNTQYKTLDDFNAYQNTTFGIRPVITVSKSDLS